MSKPQAGGTAFEGCIPIPSSCGGTATCACMGCVCGDYGLACDNIAEDTSTGAGLVIHCK